MQAAAKSAGYTSLSGDMEQDIRTLDGLDKEVSRLLKRRQNGQFSKKDKLRLQELVDTRETIEIKYKLTAADTEGFTSIQSKVAAAEARAQALGKTDADPETYKAALVASAEGIAAVNAQLDTQYEKEFSLIQLMQNGAEKDNAQSALNARYMQDRKAAALEYAALLAGIVMPVWNSADIQQVDSDIDALYTKMREYSVAASNADQLGMSRALADMNALTQGLEEGQLVEYLGLVAQILSLVG